MDLSNRQPFTASTLLMAIVRAYGMTGLYILILGPLSRLVLDAPRTVGAAAWIFQFLLITLASIIAVLSVTLFFTRWEYREKIKNKGRLKLATEMKMRNRQLTFAVGGVIAILALVLIDNLPAAERWTPFNAMLLSVSFLSVGVIECLRLRHSKP